MDILDFNRTTPMFHYLIDAIVIGNRIIDYITPSADHPWRRRFALTFIGLAIMLPTAVGVGYYLLAANILWWSYLVSFVVVIGAAIIMTIGALIAIKD